MIIDLIVVLSILITYWVYGKESNIASDAEAIRQLYRRNWGGLYSPLAMIAKLLKFGIKHTLGILFHFGVVGISLILLVAFLYLIPGVMPITELGIEIYNGTTITKVDPYDNQIKFVDADNVEHGFIRLKSNNDSERYDLNIASNIVVTSIIRATPDMYSWWFAHTYVTNRRVVVNRDGELCKYK